MYIYKRMCRLSGDVPEKKLAPSIKDKLSPVPATFVTV